MPESLLIKFSYVLSNVNHLLGSLRSRFWQANFQDSVVKLGLNLVFSNFLWYWHRSTERTIASLSSVIVFPFFFSIFSLRPRYSENAIFKVDIDVLLVNARQVTMNNQALILQRFSTAQSKNYRFTNIDCRVEHLHPLHSLTE